MSTKRYETNLKVIKSGNIPTPTELPDGHFAYGKIGENQSPRLFGNIDGEISEYGGGSGIIDGGDRGQYLVKNSNANQDVRWHTLAIEKLHVVITNTVENEPLTLFLPTSTAGTNILVKVFANGNLDAIQGERLAVSGNVITYTPSFTGSDVTLWIIYGSNEYELPTNYQYIEGEFIVPQEAVGIEIANLISLGFKLAGTIQLEMSDGTDESWGTHISHTFTAAGTYTFKVTDKYGVLSSFNFYNQSIKVISKLTRCEGTAFTSLGNMFRGATLNTISFSEGFKFKTPNVTNLTYMFTEATVAPLPDGIFSECKLVTAVNYMFNKATIEHIPSNLFEGLDEITTVASFAHSSNIVSVGEGLFKNKKLVGVPSFESSTVQVIGDSMLEGNPTITGAASMFRSCANLVEIPKNTFRGCSGITSFERTFLGCKLITTLDEDLFSDCTEVTTINGMCSGCSALAILPSGLLRAMTKLSIAATAFSCGAGAIRSIGAGFLDPIAGSITNMQEMFYNCTLAEGNLNEIATQPFLNVTTVSKMFQNGKLLTGSGMAFIALFTPAPAITAGALAGCTGLSDYVAMAGNGWR